VREVVALGTEGGAGNLIIAEITRVHIDEAVLNAEGRIDQNKIDLVARLGENWYCRASGNALFEVEKPLTTIGIGVDAIPEDIRNSEILTGNDIGKLGNVEELPNETDVNEFKLLELSDLFIEYQDEPKELEKKLHEIAHNYLKENKKEEAWKTLLAFNN
jgi:hypothetical protein